MDDIFGAKSEPSCLELGRVVPGRVVQAPQCPNIAHNGGVNGNAFDYDFIFWSCQAQSKLVSMFLMLYGYNDVAVTLPI